MSNNCKICGIGCKSETKAAIKYSKENNYLPFKIKFY